VVFGPDLRVEGLDAGGQDDGADVDVDLLRFLLQIDGVVLTDRLTDTALLLFEIEAALVDVGDQGDGLGEVDVDRLVERDVLVVLVRVFCRAVLDAGRAARAFVLFDVSRSLGERDVEVPCLSFYTVDISIGEDLDVRVPADLDQLGCENSHRAVVCGKRLVKLGHVAPDAGGFLDHVHLEARGGEVE
jgi:hypothetical protein